MKVVLYADNSEECQLDIQPGKITFTIKKNDYAFNLKDFDDSEAFLKEKNKVGEGRAEKPVG